MLNTQKLSYSTDLILYDIDVNETPGTSQEDAYQRFALEVSFVNA